MDIANSRLAALIGHAYVWAPRRADTLFDVARRYVMPALRYRIPLRRLRGRTADGSPGSMLAAGTGPNLDYMTGRFFDGSPQVEALGWATPLSIGRWLDRLEDGDDLVLARIARPIGALMQERFVRVPDMVELWLEVVERDQVLRRATPSLRRKMRALRQRGLTWSLSHHPADFERFYCDYYRPFVLARFGNLAIVEAPTVMRRRFRLGSVMWIWRDGEAVAAQLLEPDGDVLRMLSMGTIHGRQEHRACGVLEATRLFGVEHALAAGHSWLSLGASLPSLKEGPLMKKREWGGLLRQKENSHRDFVIRWPSFNRRVARFLDDVPLVIRDGRKLSALTAISSASPLDPAVAFQRWRQLAPRDLHCLYVVAPHGWQAIRAGTALPPNGCVRLCDAGPSESVLASAREATTIAA